MKTKKLFLLISFSLLAYASCKKQIGAENEVFGKLSPLTLEVLGRTNLLELKQGQALLSADERDALWTTKLDYILNNTKETFTAEQRKIVLMLQEFLKKKGIKQLLQDPDLSNAFMSTYLPYFSKHFNKEQLNILIESPYFKDGMLISKFNQTNMVPYYPASESKPLSPFATESAPAAHCTCKYDLGCPNMGNDCDNAKCATDDDKEMCGLFGTEHCLMRCHYTQPDLD